MSDHRSARGCVTLRPEVLNGAWRSPSQTGSLFVIVNFKSQGVVSALEPVFEGKPGRHRSQDGTAFGILFL